MHDFFNEIQLQQASKEYALFRVNLIITIDLKLFTHPNHRLMKTDNKKKL